MHSRFICLPRHKQTIHIVRRSSSGALESIGGCKSDTGAKKSPLASVQTQIQCSLKQSHFLEKQSHSSGEAEVDLEIF